MREDRPEIELYMYSLNQEFPVGTGHSTFLVRDTKDCQAIDSRFKGVRDTEQRIIVIPPGWRVKWASQWIFNVAGLSGSPERLIVRKEDFGGILFDPALDRVYKVNKPGYRLIQEILQAQKEEKLAEFRSREFQPEETEHFIYFLKGAGLWPV